MRQLLIAGWILLSITAVSAWSEEWVNDFQKKITITAAGVEVNQVLYPWNKETISEIRAISSANLQSATQAECRARTQIAQKVNEQVVLVDTYRRKPTILWGVFCRFFTNIYSYQEPLAATQTVLSTNEQNVLVRQSTVFLDVPHRPALSVNDLLNPQLLEQPQWVTFMKTSKANQQPNIEIHQEIYRRVSPSP